MAFAGSDEGAFAWLTLNYLLGRLGKAEHETMAAIDLGGGSVQQAFAVTEAEAQDAPEGYITKLTGGGRTYHVYVHRCKTPPPPLLPHIICQRFGLPAILSAHLDALSRNSMGVFTFLCFSIFRSAANSLQTRANQKENK